MTKTTEDDIEQMALSRPEALGWQVAFGRIWGRWTMPLPRPSPKGRATVFPVKPLLVSRGYCF